MAWDRRFGVPIALLNGRVITTLSDAREVLLTVEPTARGRVALSLQIAYRSSGRPRIHDGSRGGPFGWAKRRAHDLMRAKKRPALQWHGTAGSGSKRLIGLSRR